MAMFPPPEQTPLIDRADVLPTVDDVALLLRTRTVGGVATGLGSDTGPADVTTFTATTRPTATEAGLVIDHAADEVLGQLPARADVGLYDAIRRVIALRAAALIEVSFFRDTARDEIVAAYLGNLRELRTVLPADIAIASGLSAREQTLLDAWNGPSVLAP